MIEVVYCNNLTGALKFNCISKIKVLRNFSYKLLTKLHSCCFHGTEIYGNRIKECKVANLEKKVLQKLGLFKQRFQTFF